MRTINFEDGGPVLALLRSDNGRMWDEAVRAGRADLMKQARQILLNNVFVFGV